MVASVVVACQVGTPPTSASTCPLVPAVVVATAPEPFPRRSVFDWSAAQPVPPFVVATTPVTLLAVPPMLSVEVDTWYRAPLFAPTTPESEARTGVAVKVCTPPQVLEVVVPKASEMFGVLPFEERIG